MNNPPAFVSITPRGDAIDIIWGFTTYKKKEAGKISCFIPAFNIYFSASNEEMVDRKSKAMTRIYVYHFLEHNGKNGLKKFAMQLHKLGFKAPDDAYTLKKILNNEVVKTKFKSINNILPLDFKNAESDSHELELEVAR